MSTTTPAAQIVFVSLAYFRWKLSYWVNLPDGIVDCNSQSCINYSIFDPNFIFNLHPVGFSTVTCLYFTNKAISIMTKVILQCYVIYEYYVTVFNGKPGKGVVVC